MAPHHQRRKASAIAGTMSALGAVSKGVVRAFAKSAAAPRGALAKKASEPGHAPGHAFAGPGDAFGRQAPGPTFAALCTTPGFLAMATQAVAATATAARPTNQVASSSMDATPPPPLLPMYAYATHMAPLVGAAARAGHRGEAPRPSPSAGAAPPASAHPLEKTRLCKFHTRKKCKRGEACTFAHNSSELQPKPNLFKTRICADLTWGGSCRLGELCTYAHSPEELRPRSSSARQDDLPASDGSSPPPRAAGAAPAPEEAGGEARQQLQAVKAQIAQLQARIRAMQDAPAAGGGASGPYREAPCPAASPAAAALPPPSEQQIAASQACGADADEAMLAGSLCARGGFSRQSTTEPGTETVSSFSRQVTEELGPEPTGAFSRQGTGQSWGVWYSESDSEVGEVSFDLVVRNTFLSMAPLCGDGAHVARRRAKSAPRACEGI